MFWDEAMERKLRSIREEYPLVWAELEKALAPLSREEAQYLKAIYAGLGVYDLTAVSPEQLLGYVRPSQRARRELPYAGEVPEELFFRYVLPPRVNNENLDGSRAWLYEQLAERVRGKTMLAAALEVNYWCYEKATY
ncbi:MAG: hypothetical protein ACI3WR_08885, partial [Oscillospiraceae bacterium]